MAIIDGTNRHLSGWKLDSHDPRDFLLSVDFQKKLPLQADIRALCSRIEDQGELGSCTANSSTSVAEFLYRKFGKPDTQLSRLFLYYATRVWVEHTEATDDSGAQIRDVMKALAKYGVCLESLWPYVTDTFSQAPNPQMVADAAERKILTYHKCNGLHEIKSCIVDGYPLAGGFSVPENMQSEECAKTGIVKFPTKEEEIIGGHAVQFVGYDDHTELLAFANSWSTSWGDKGFGYLPYKFVSDQLASDFWTIRTEEL